jgi:pyruvyl transferase EpsI
MKNIINIYTPDNIKHLIKYIRLVLFSSRKYSGLNSKSKKIIVMLAADYGNLGDVAITYAQKEFLLQNFEDYEVILLGLNRFYRDIRSLKSKLNSDDIITIIGGGNISNAYQGIEDKRIFVIKYFPDNKIISFPQSIDFSDNDEGRVSAAKSIKVYNDHKNLVIVAREEKSFKEMKRLFVGDVLLLPDIALSLNLLNSPEKREFNNVILCLRDDIESNTSISKKRNLISYLNHANKKITYKDTYIGEGYISTDQSMSELNDLWKSFKLAELVITDRLHGMIFCALTMTPCIAINNNNGKVYGVYSKWLSSLRYIVMIEALEVRQIKKSIEQLNSLTPSDFVAPSFDHEFDELKKVINN